MKFRRLYTVLCLAVITTAVWAQPPFRPRIWGIASMTFRVSDIQRSREFYEDFLGFRKVFKLENKDSKKIRYVFKINDRQFIELIPTEKPLPERKMACVSFEVDDVKTMEKYFASQDVKILEPAGKDAGGNISLRVEGPDGHVIAFTQYLPDSRHGRIKGTYLSPHRIAPRLHHAGFSVSGPSAANAFFKDKLNFKEMWRAKPSDQAVPNYIYMQVPGCVENIEYIVNPRREDSHLCFVLPDMQAALDRLHSRKGDREIGKPFIGSGNRWLLSIRDPDGIRIEFTEPHTVR